MNKIDEIVIIALTFISALILINHIVFNLFSDTAFKFALLYPVWLLIYAGISVEVEKRGQK